MSPHLPRLPAMDEVIHWAMLRVHPGVMTAERFSERLQCDLQRSRKVFSQMVACGAITRDEKGGHALDCNSPHLPRLPVMKEVIHWMMLRVHRYVMTVQRFVDRTECNLNDARKAFDEMVACGAITKDENGGHASSA